MRWRRSPLENENGNEEQGGPYEMGIDKNPGSRLSVSVQLLVDLVVYLMTRLTGLMMSIGDFCECGEALERHFGQFCICPLAQCTISISSFQYT